MSKKRAIRKSAARRHRRACPWTSADECATARERRTGTSLSCGARHKKRRNPSPVRGLRRTSPSKRHPTRAGQGMPWPWLDRTTGGLLYVRRGLRRLRPYRPSAKRRNPLLQVVTPNGHGSRKPKWPYTTPRTKRRLLTQAMRQLIKDPTESNLNHYLTRLSAMRGRYHPSLLKRRQNPLLQVVTPNPVIKGYAGRGGARVRGGQRLSGVRFVSPSEARTYPGFAKSLATFKAFHGHAPTHFTRVRLEDGDKHVSRRAVVMVGEAPAIEYRTWRYANSTKSHTKDGRRITWRHKMGELGGKPAYYVHDPVSGVTSLLGGTYRVAGRPAFYHH